MHYVCRGNQPNSLKPIRRKYTKAWVEYYSNGIGKKPTDRRWQEYRGVLGKIFGECCGYCEEYCEGEVDHFKPKRWFPNRVYVWDNWIYACHTCNNNKREEWPTSGFLDPCCSDTFCNGIQSCFIYELQTGWIFPNPKLPKAARKRAQVTIDILELNSTNKLKSRLEHICMIEALAKLAAQNNNSAIEELALRSLPERQYYSITRYFLGVH